MEPLVLCLPGKKIKVERSGRRGVVVRGRRDRRSRKERSEEGRLEREKGIIK